MSNKLLQNAKEVQAGFRKLDRTITKAASRTAAATLASQDAFKMTFDDTEAIPITVPSSGTIMIVGLSEANVAEIDDAVTRAAGTALGSMSEQLMRLMREEGYD